MTNVTDFIAAAVDKVRKSWAWFLVTGILLIILGALCIGKAQTATTFSILTLGWILVISAAAWLVCAFYTFGTYGFSSYFPNQVLRGVTGYLLISHPSAGAQAVTILLALLFIVLGIFRGAMASLYKFPGWRWSVLSGVVTFGLGVFVLAAWHRASTYLFGAVIGVDLIFDGVSLLGFASAIHRLPIVQRKAALHDKAA